MSEVLRRFVAFGLRAFPDLDVDPERVVRLAEIATGGHDPMDEGVAFRLVLLTIAFVRAVEDVLAGRLEFDPSEEMLVRHALNRFLGRLPDGRVS